MSEQKPPQPERRPYRCPICGGSGLVPHGYYDKTAERWTNTITIAEMCRTCEGAGVIWG
jgi:DnaJ-class molecular chaperone